MYEQVLVPIDGSSPDEFIALGPHGRRGVRRWSRGKAA